jgi:hypothetical protein
MYFLYYIFFIITLLISVACNNYIEMTDSDIHDNTSYDNTSILDKGLEEGVESLGQSSIPGVESLGQSSIPGVSNDNEAITTLQ